MVTYNRYTILSVFVHSNTRDYGVVDITPNRGESMPPKFMNSLQRMMIVEGKNAWFAGERVGCKANLEEKIYQFFKFRAPAWVRFQVDSLKLPAPPVVLALPAPIL